MILKDKKALVTGASRGIGRAIAERFLREGAEVWALGTRRPDDLPGGLHWLEADLGRLEDLEARAVPWLEEAGGFDILVNNAGRTRDGLSLRMKLGDFQQVLDLNLSAPFLLARTVAGDLIRRGRGGVILNMASVVGIHGNGGQANYAASKGGLIALTKTLALEYGSRNIRVNAIAPGFIDSDMTRALPEKVRSRMLEGIPLKRPGRPDDVAGTALFLASEEGAYITGQVIPVDGGMFM